ncbi:BLUF domain-containing protein [Parasphingopyxis marina]|uniref:BLUF domain-containing protein n=1 Tax=Parasphingopyxis marina TaxID=2761622 RepID=A0A842HVP7_9SPHN|nr:BLUF domain-containing protein [Parasphingopyxis marina]MBC2778118.1 BLUF domain-containing protein [Parasphingopyxis marina]
MYRLIYVSSVRPHVGVLEVEQIVDVARDRNADRDLTGLLIYDGKRFLQYLEGEEAKVEAVFERIAEDERHYALVVLARGDVQRRQFPDWAMASRNVDDGDTLTMAVARMVQGCDEHVAAELIGFAEAREKAA